MSFEWKIYVRDQNYERQGVLDEYAEATIIPAYNDVGTWEIKVDRRSDMADKLVTPGWGIMVFRDGSPVQPLFSGPFVQRHDVVSTDEQTITISGVADDVWLRDRVASPSPSSSGPPYSTVASDDLTDIASTVLRHYVDANIGPGAIGPRQVPGLTIATDPLLGQTVVGSGRWGKVLPLLQDIAESGGVGFRIAQVGAGLQFQVYQGTDRSGTVKFSIPLGTLAGFDYQITRPTANYVYVGGTGDGTTRIMAEQSAPPSVAEWGRIEGDLVNSSDSSDPAKLQQDGTAALEQGAAQTSLSITPVEKDGMRYGIDYFLGDTVSVQLEGPGDGVIQDLLRSVTIKLTPDGPQTITPSIGTAAAVDVFRMAKTFRLLKSYGKRLTNLERH